MRVPRYLIVVAGFATIPLLFTLLSLTSSHGHRHDSTTSTAVQEKGRFRALFSFSTPSTLFPTSAIISLTDDNSTFFVARPAAFGPLLASKGLSGQLWVGIGFGDDNYVRRGGAADVFEGELGCSDVPGWGEEHEGHNSRILKGDALAKISGGSKLSQSSDQDLKRTGGRTHSKISGDAHPPSPDDGTDDYLYHPLAATETIQRTESGQRSRIDHGELKAVKPHHADIQSLQESAEIAGRIVLLNRGGCGFLEKVKWTQRRGGVALIIGDNTRGGGLITMYAQGDTSNVTIPSFFTSYTTAHLLSSLIPAESHANDGITATKSSHGKGNKKSKHGAKKMSNRKKMSKPTFTSTPKATLPARPISNSGRVRPSSEAVVEPSPFQVKESSGWIRSVLTRLGIGGKDSISVLTEGSRRPPSSGELDWVLVEDWTEGEVASLKGSSVVIGDSAHGKSASRKSGSVRDPSQPADDFVIGVQDWRDPDLRGLPPTDTSTQSRSTTSAVKETATGRTKDKIGNSKKLEGGSITPGSGEYLIPDELASDRTSDDTATTFMKSASMATVDGSSIRWYQGLPGLASAEGKSHLVGKLAKGAKFANSKHDDVLRPTIEQSDAGVQGLQEEEQEEEHEGLWVTLTLTTISVSPFFDTLLVLVVSPLVTLTVVYAILLLRSRIRRRAWRAPKSVVDQLPVRLYRAAPPSSHSSSSRLSALSATSAIVGGEGASLQRPRSRTASSVPNCGENAPTRPTSDHETPHGTSDGPEKHPRAAPDWKTRYRGRQVECVVCLEEYINGVSKVMRLPCGHEFHVECITPWLMTRRRTCPICKGDVVRSLAQGSSSSSTSDTPYRDDASEIGVPEEGMISTSALPIPTASGTGTGDDLERGETSPLLENSRSPSRPRWSSLLGISLDTIREISGSFGGDSPRRRTHEERDR